ncbi:MAG: PEP-CTERM sorting domain-containing protein [Kiritimatiellales bacterium]
MRAAIKQWVMLALLVLIGGVATAGVVYEENFDDGVANGWVTGGTAGTYTYTVSGGMLQGVDSSSAGYSLDYVNQNSFIPFSTENDGSEIIKLSFDFRIDNYTLSLGSPETFRFLFQPQGQDTRYALGLGYAAVNGVNKVFLFADSGSTPTPSASNAIGYNSGSGTWDAGFDLGSTVSDGTGGDFFRFSLTSDSTTGDMQITVENLTTGTTTTYLDTTDPYVMSTSKGCTLWVVTGVSSVGTVMLDNVSLSAVPEPASIALTLFAGAGVFFFRRLSTK